MLRQLTEQDANFLYLETSDTPEHVGGVHLVELPVGYQGDFYEDYRAIVASRMHLIAFMHSKLAMVPLGVDRPFWVQDDHVDLDYHIRHETVPKPGGMQQLEQLVGRLHGGLLDRSRPLWEFYVIDGLESGQCAIYTKIHHAAMDGASSQALVCTIYDPTPTPRTFPGPDAEPGDVASHDQEHADFGSMAQGVLAHLVRQEIRAVQFVPELLKAWTKLVLPNPETLRYESIPKAPHTPKTLFNVRITNQRVYAARTLSLSAFKQVGKLTGTKVNDVILAVCSGTLAGYLSERSALPAQSLTATVPISLREPAEHDLANHNAMFMCSLATDLADPYERLLAIHSSAGEQKKRFDALRRVALPELPAVGGGWLMPQLVELYGRANLFESLPLFGNLTISNVQGPPIPLYIAGARVLSLYPCSIPFHGAALNITVQSYGDRLDFGLVACRRAVPDLALLADGLLPSLIELQQSVAKHVAPLHAEIGSGTPKLDPSTLHSATVAAALGPAAAQVTTPQRRN